jgi:hypothetical protein
MRSIIAIPGDHRTGLFVANFVEKLPQSPDAKFYLRSEPWFVSSI